MKNETQKEIAAARFDRIHKEKVFIEETARRSTARYRARPLRETESRKNRATLNWNESFNKTIAC